MDQREEIRRRINEVMASAKMGELIRAIARRAQPQPRPLFEGTVRVKVRK